LPLTTCVVVFLFGFLRLSSALANAIAFDSDSPFTLTRLALVALFVAVAFGLYTMYQKRAAKQAFPRYAPV
jgi:EamA domain-containing membrane protein RarD